MPKKSITIEVDDLVLKNLHILAIENDLSRKAFIEECVDMVGRSDDLLVKVKKRIQKEKPES